MAPTAEIDFSVRKKKVWLQMIIIFVLFAQVLGTQRDGTQSGSSPSFSAHLMGAYLFLRGIDLLLPG